MPGRLGAESVMASIVDVCHRGYPPERLKAEVMVRLQRIVPVDALWWATSDPATVLFTQAYREGIPDRLIPAFVDNEFLGRDVNRWTELAQDPVGVRTMAGATAGRLGSSARFRDLLQPIGLGDELRAVLRTGDSCWGLMCLHRELDGTFSHTEQQYVRRLAPHLAEGLRAGLLMTGAGGEPAADAPGLVVLDPSGELVSATAAARAWFAELGALGEGGPVPAEVRTAAALLSRPDRPASAEVAAVIMAAYGLTERERAVTGLVCQGRSTAQMAAELWISTNTVQDHLKSIFDKTGVRSRGEVMATILRDHYLPALHQGRPVGPSGFFDSKEVAGAVLDQAVDGTIPARPTR
jgi:DNA-binding CsgD family transcriptional regulator